MIALIVAALAAILGLIPLWRAVYRRYAVPPPTPPPALSQPLPGALAGLLAPPGTASQAAEVWPLAAGEQRQGWQEAANQAKAGAKLDNFGLVWYNFSVAKHPVLRPMPAGKAALSAGLALGHAQPNARLGTGSAA